MTDTALGELICQGESFRVEYKETLDGTASTRFRGAVCAFANDVPSSGQAGVVFVGLTDHGELSDLDVDNRLLTQLNRIKTEGDTLPPPSLLVEKRTRQG